MINKVILVGRVGADPEIRTMGESGVKTARIRLATSEKYFNKQTNQSEELTEWHNVTLWRNLADVADKFVRKGSLLYVEGTIHYRKWQGKDGAEHSMTDITATELKMLNKVEVAEQTEPQYQPVEYPTTAPAAEPEMVQDDLPF
ncbi:MAG: single-stranded DNA-binding protein [Alistipes sp.]|nr:single-stranded DNA-binding protein [Alistipes sp.]